MSDVTTEHPKYTQSRVQVEKMRDALAGEYAIKRRKGQLRHGRFNDTGSLAREEVRYDWAGERYLPRLYNQEAHEYQNYLSRATWLDATKRTLQFYLSLIFRKTATVEGAEDNPVLDRIGVDFANFHEVANTAAREFIGMGRVGLMVDTSEAAADRTMLERERSQEGPFIAVYERESIINWKYRIIENRPVLSLVVLMEDQDTSTSEFGHETEKVYRVLRLRTDGERRYTSAVYDGEGNEIQPETAPLMNGRPMQEIPFWIVDTQEGISPLDGIANLNIAHFRNTADLENAAHKIGVPTPYFSGYDGENDGPIFLGADRAIVSSNPDFKASFLEFHGVGLSQLIQVINDKRRDMANLGARLLMDESRFNEAADTVAMRKSGEASVIVELASTLSQALTEVVRVALAWNGTPNDEARVHLNRDLLPHAMSHQMVVALVNAWIAGGISHRDLIERLKDGEMIDTERSFEDILADIEEDMERQSERMLEMQPMIGRHADQLDNGRAGEQVTASRGNA